MFSLLVPTLAPMSTASSSALLQQVDPPVEIWVSKTDARLGDRVKVHARAEADGYLLVLHAEPDGRVRVLFPIDPLYDNFVRGGDRFQIRSRGDREAFRVYSSSGSGTVYAAFSRDPFRFDEFARGNHWDYGVPDLWWVTEDAEADLTNLASQMAGGAFFDYDLLEYNVWDANVASSGSTTHVSYYGGYPYHSTWSFGIGFNWGWDYYPYDYYWYRPYYRPWRSYGWYGGWWNPWNYDPFYYDWYYPHRYRYSYGYGYYPRYYGGGYVTTVPYGNTGLRYRPRLAASNSNSRTRRAYVPTSAAGRRLAASSSSSPTSRGVTTAGRRTMPSVATRTDSRNTTARRTTTTTAQRSRPTTTRQTSQPSTARRVTPTSRTTTRATARPTRTTSSRGAATARRSPTTRQVTPPARTTRSTARTSRPTVQRSQPTRSTSVRRPSAPSRSSARSAPRTTSEQALDIQPAQCVTALGAPREQAFDIQPAPHVEQ
jgi:hypothetical protein